MKAISVLGSTGSIGTQTLQIVDDFPDQFRVVALTAGRNLALLVEQIQRHQPELVALADEALLPELKQRLEALDPSDRPAQCPEMVGGPDGLEVAAAWGSAELVVTGIVGCAGLLPTLAAVRAGKDLALANKETLIAAGPVVLPELKKAAAACCQRIQNTPPFFNACRAPHGRTPLAYPPAYPPLGCDASNSPHRVVHSAIGTPQTLRRPRLPMPPVIPTGAWAAKSRSIPPP
jgi:hypothetical protein